MAITASAAERVSPEQIAPELIARDGELVGSANASICPMSIRGLTVSYGGKPAVFSVDADMPAETMTAIIGPNGAGKSTLLKGALGIVPKLSGEVHIFGQPFDKTRHRVAYVPQRASVDWDFPARVIDLVVMGLYAQIGLLRFAGSRHRKAALTCLDRVGMAEFAHRQIGQLSGGQQQRVFLARALAQNADLYLLDEPFAGVDAATEKAIVSVLKSLKEDKRTVVCVHHDLTTVADYFDRTLFINVRKIAEGPTDRVFTEENLQATYGGRLAATHIEDLRLGAG
ncbi:MAG: metal ABC transporter ATP-binding protein [Pseudomonadota bacterium]